MIYSCQSGDDSIIFYRRKHDELCCEKRSMSKNNEFVDIYSITGGNGRPSNNRKKKKSKRKTILIAVGAILAIVLLALASAYLYVHNILGNMERVELPSSNAELGISPSAESSDDVINIALYGIDTRGNDDAGRTDSIVVLTIDKVHDKIKLASIARDTYVSIDGYGQDKINHAWAYGKAPLAVKTLNQNFNLDITRFVAVNFYQFAHIIDYIGGVVIDVSEAEMQVMNNYIPELQHLGIDCEYITSPGEQRLSGGQALVYARNRYTGNGDVERGNRQKRVIEAMFEQVKNVSKSQYPALVSMVLSECSTSLTNKEIIDMALWAATNSVSFAELSLPNSECNAYGDIINGVWYYIYDLSNATRILKEFIYET